MLLKLSAEIAECYRHAEDCAARAKRESDAALRDDWRAMEKRWLFLARSYELTERIQKFQPKRRKTDRHDA
jgi:hypothetical protein